MARLQTAQKTQKTGKKARADISTDNRTNKRKIGDIGENAVSEYLKSRGFVILDRNYLRKWGELDIVAQKKGKVHFIEVKSISRETQYRAEDNLHPNKLRRLGRIITTYLLDKNISDNVDWQFDVALVLVDQIKRICRVKIMEDIVL